MSSFARIAAGLVLAAALSGAAGADDLSGPLRKTLTEETWGTIYYVPTVLKDYDYSRNAGEGLRTMSSALGKVVVRDAGIGSFDIDYPDGSHLKVDSQPNGVNVTFRNQTYSFVREGKTMRVKLPDDEITYTLTQRELVIAGKKGLTKIVQSEGNYLMESPAGVFSYVPDPEGGFKVRGAPAAQYPYMLRGALFESAGVGVFVDLRRLDPESPLFRFMEWVPTLEYH